MKDVLVTPIRLCIASTPGHLPIVRATVERAATVLGFDEVACGRIVLAVDEALTNIIRHAYHGRKDGPIEITFRCVPDGTGGGALQVELRDWGSRADPQEIKSRDLDDIRPGGLGVHIMNSVMDKLEYTPGPDGGTRLTMTKTL